MVSEAGASVYSASALAAAELPGMDVSLRGAVSIARRLQDPLAELVKIEPKSIGVGQYQHDVTAAKLDRSLDAVVEDCVNAVGVDVNTASPALLSRVAGVGPLLSENIVAYRNEHGPFAKRSELKKVPRLGAKAFEQCAGFLRITGGAEPLDASSVHPEAYPVARKILAAAGTAPAGGSYAALNPQDFVDGTFGLPTVQDIIAELEKPGRDPRPAFAAATFSEGIEKISDLKPGMVLEGTVTNVAAFGAFVDVGVHQDGLVHVSALANRFVSDPREVVKSGQVVRVKVLEADPERKRISLTLEARRRTGTFRWPRRFPAGACTAGPFEANVFEAGAGAGGTGGTRGSGIRAQTRGGQAPHGRLLPAGSRSNRHWSIPRWPKRSGKRGSEGKAPDDLFPAEHRGAVNGQRDGERHVMISLSAITLPSVSFRNADLTAPKSITSPTGFPSTPAKLDRVRGWKFTPRALRASTSSSMPVTMKLTTGYGGGTGPAFRSGRCSSRRPRRMPWGPLPARIEGPGRGRHGKRSVRGFRPAPAGSG